ncbi:MAG: 50S ribosomal protein L25, partial [Alteromonadaceae bacterium]|nr:50S ribosomal protein L25 [Alteromonadaceae bacterium]
PFKQVVMHLDFLRFDPNHAVHTKIPLHFINEDNVTKSGAIIAHHVTEIAISCLPKDLPAFIEVDLVDMEVGQTIHLSDVILPSGITSDELSKGENHDQAVATANAPKGNADDSEEKVEEAETTED